jgi:predicted transcriptional regulator
MDTKHTSHRQPRWTESYRVRVGPETYEKVQELARRRETTISQLTRVALARYVEEQECYLEEKP